MKKGIDTVSGYDTFPPMICPHCKKDIPDAAVAKHLASKGGKASKRKITPEQQTMMQERAREWRTKNQQEKP